MKRFPIYGKPNSPRSESGLGDYAPGFLQPFECIHSLAFLSNTCHFKSLALHCHWTFRFPPYLWPFYLRMWLLTNLWPVGQQLSCPFSQTPFIFGFLRTKPVVHNLHIFWPSQAILRWWNLQKQVLPGGTLNRNGEKQTVQKCVRLWVSQEDSACSSFISMSSFRGG